jgi:putative AdoMet-dependent methyltransferase
MGREFLSVFENWAEDYDNSVNGHNEEYKKVFEHYDEILEHVAKKSNGRVLEFGAGTGNLTAKLIEQGKTVNAIEPSPEMRVIGEKKLNHTVPFLDGDFLIFPSTGVVNTIVSTYAFHHLTDEEKQRAFSKYGKLLAKGDKIVFADTMFLTQESYNDTIKTAKKNGFGNLAEDLQREYYTTIPVFESIAKETGFTVQFERCNDFVWIMEATKE